MDKSPAVEALIKELIRLEMANYTKLARKGAYGEGVAVDEARIERDAAGITAIKQRHHDEVFADWAKSQPEQKIVDMFKEKIGQQKAFAAVLDKEVPLTRDLAEAMADPAKRLTDEQVKAKMAVVEEIRELREKVVTGSSLGDKQNELMVLQAKKTPSAEDKENIDALKEKVGTGSEKFLRDVLHLRKQKVVFEQATQRFEASGIRPTEELSERLDMTGITPRQLHGALLREPLSGYGIDKPKAEWTATAEFLKTTDGKGFKTHLDAKDLEALRATGPVLVKVVIPEVAVDAAKLKSVQTPLKAGATAPTFVMITPGSESNLRTPEHASKLASWKALKDTLTGLGAKVVVLEPKDRDSSGHEFTRDAAVVLSTKEKEKVFLSPDPIKAKLIRGVDGRIDATAAHLKSREFKGVQSRTYFEGGDVIYDAEKKLLMVGHPISEDILPDSKEKLERDLKRWEADKGGDPAAAKEFIGEIKEKLENLKVGVTTEQRKEELEKNLKEAGIKDATVMMVERKQAKEFYHLDLGMAKLPNGELLVVKDMVDEKTMGELKKQYGDKLLTLSKADAGLVSNHVAIGDTLVAPDVSDAAKGLLEKHGYKVATPKALGMEGVNWNFGGDKEGVGPHCMTLEIAMVQEQYPEMYKAVMMQLASSVPARPSASEALEPRAPLPVVASLKQNAAGAAL